MIALSRVSTRAANNADLRDWPWLLFKVHTYFRVLTPECTNDGISRRASHYIISVICSFKNTKILSGSLFYLENLCASENSTYQQPRLYAWYSTRVLSYACEAPVFCCCAHPTWRSVGNNQTVLGSCLSKMLLSTMALRVPSTSPFHEYITCVPRNIPGERQKYTDVLRARICFSENFQ